MNQENDELECFKKASELGCKDFCIVLGEVCIALPDATNLKKVQLTNIPIEEAGGGRINRFASAVCAEWWYRQTLDNGHKGFAVWNHCNRMMEEARAFGKKYGALLLALCLCLNAFGGDTEMVRLLKSGAKEEAKDFRPRWAKRDLTYRFADGVPAIARESLVAACAEWREETKRYSYTEVYEGGDIVIEWKPDASDKLADTTVTLSNDSKSIASAVITINSRHRWPHPLWSLGRVMAHELGHALGLGHSTDKGSIMFYRQSMAPCRADVAELEK